MKFRDMPYERPNPNEVKAKIAEFIEREKAASSYEEAKAIFMEQEKETKHTMTMANLSSIRNSINTKDAFYEGEKNFWNQFEPELEECMHQWNNALLDSPFRKNFEEEFGEIVTLNAEISKRSFSPEMVPLMVKENELDTRYSKLIASAQIPFKDGIYTLSQLAPFKTSADDEERLAAWKAEGAWYKENQAELDEIYDELVKLRTSMGKMLGYENFVPLGYDRMTRNCYDKNDVEKFRKAVVKYLVPVAESIYKKQAERLGKDYPLSFADAALEFRSGNPRPKGTADDIVAAGKKFYDELSPETSVFFNTMLDNELMDLLSTEGKRAGGYCTSIPDYEVPFIFANFNGTQHDVEVVTHEAGHAFAAWTNRKRVPMSTVWPSMEGCEVHSMSMEFFADPWAEDFFGDDKDKYLYSHLSGSITFIPYGTMVDHFQHIVYENPELTPSERHVEWKKLLGIYMPWMKLDGEIPVYSDGEGWQRQLHIYGMPFYYIDYCLAQTVALMFWAMIQEDKDNAWKHYMAYTDQGGSTTFTELLKNAELDSPFDENTLRSVCEKAKAYLDNFNITWE